MSIEIIGAGLQRTGTVTLKRALECLGFIPCYHGFANAKEHAKALFQACADPINWEALLGNYRAAVDDPISTFYRELAELYPAAKVILTVRDPNEWYNSITHLFDYAKNGNQRFLRIWEQSDLREKIDASEFGRRTKNIMMNGRNRHAMIAKFMERTAEAQAVLPADRLLVYNVADGWGPLCEFLGIPTPSVPFPRVNSTSTLYRDLDHFYEDFVKHLPPGHDLSVESRFS